VAGRPDEEMAHLMRDRAAEDHGGRGPRLRRHGVDAPGIDGDQDASAGGAVD